MTLSKFSGDLRRFIRPLEEDASGYRASKATVERLIDAMLSGSKVLPRVEAIVGNDGDAGAFMESIRKAIRPALVASINALGGHVSGMSAASARSALRGMAQEDAPSVPLE